MADGSTGAILIVFVLIGLAGVVAASNGRSGDVASPRLSDPDKPQSSQAITKLRTGKIEIVPGALYALITTGTVETTVDGVVQCWNYASDGLMKVGQQEVFLSILKGSGEDEPPSDPLWLFRQFYELAKRGRVVNVGDVTLFSETHPGFLGRRALRGVVYVPLEPSSQAILPSTIGAILVTENEARAALEFGALRLMGTLGFRHRWFPTAMWNDRTRPELPVTTMDPPNSILSRLPRANYPGLTIELRSAKPALSRPTWRGGSSDDKAATFTEKGLIVVTLPTTAAQSLKEGLSQQQPGTPFALIGRPDPGAVASFAWSPGRGRQERMEVIGFLGHDGSRISAAFIAFSPATNGRTAVTSLEDGFGVVLADRDWRNLTDSLKSGREVTLASAGSASSIQVSWRGRQSKVESPAR